jgi:hypothetical protein
MQVVESEEFKELITYLNPSSFSQRKMGRKIVERHIQMEELLVRLGNFLCMPSYLYKTGTGTIPVYYGTLCCETKSKIFCWIRLEISVMIPVHVQTLTLLIMVAEPHHFDAAPALGENFNASLVAPSSTCIARQNF